MMPDERRWTIYVCDDCGEISGDQGECNVKEPIEVVPASEAERLWAERDEARATTVAEAEAADRLRAEREPFAVGTARAALDPKGEG